MKKDYNKYNEFLKNKFYKLDEKEYNNFFNYFKKNYKKHLPKDKNIKILDVGCGLGHFLFFLKKLGYKNIYGIDYDENNVKFCKSLGFKNVIKADMFDYFKKSQEMYDLIILNDVLEHIPKENLIDFLIDCKNHLTKGGVFMFKTVNCNNIYGLSSYFADFTHEVGFTKEKVMQISQLADFNKVKVYNLYIYPNIFIVDNIIYFFSKTLYKIKTILFLINGRKHNDVHSKNLLGVLEK